MGKVTITVKCDHCSRTIDEPSNIPEVERKPCPSCGSLARRYEVSIQDKITLHDKLGMKARHQAQRKPFLESTFRADLHWKSGKWMKLERIIDRAKNWYKEVVTDPRTGEVVHRCEEPLSDHKGHGSAKHGKVKKQAN